MTGVSQIPFPGFPVSGMVLEMGCSLVGVGRRGWEEFGGEGGGEGREGGSFQHSGLSRKHANASAVKIRAKALLPTPRKRITADEDGRQIFRLSQSINSEQLQAGNVHTHRKRSNLLHVGVAP